MSDVASSNEPMQCQSPDMRRRFKSMASNLNKWIAQREELGLPIVADLIQDLKFDEHVVRIYSSGMILTRYLDRNDAASVDIRVVTNCPYSNEDAVSPGSAFTGFTFLTFAHRKRVILVCTKSECDIQIWSQDDFSCPRGNDETASHAFPQTTAGSSADASAASSASNDNSSVPAINQNDNMRGWSWFG